MNLFWEVDAGEYYIGATGGTGGHIRRGRVISTTGLALSSGSLKCDATPDTIQLTNQANIYSNLIFISGIDEFTVHPGVALHENTFDFCLRHTQVNYKSVGHPQNDITISPEEYQDVAVRTPAPLPIFDATVAFGSIRKHRMVAVR